MQTTANGKYDKASATCTDYVGHTTTVQLPTIWVSVSEIHITVDSIGSDSVKFTLSCNPSKLVLDELKFQYGFGTYKNASGQIPGYPNHADSLGLTTNSLGFQIKIPTVDVVRNKYPGYDKVYCNIRFGKIENTDGHMLKQAKFVLLSAKKDEPWELYEIDDTL